MRTLIRLFYGLLGYQVFFVKQKQKDTAINLNKLEKANSDWSKRKVQKNFNKQTSSSFTLQMAAVIKNVIEDRTIHAVCDLGCGNGNLLAEISKQFQVTEALGFDFSEQAIETAKRQHPALSFYVHDIYVPLQANKYDIILCTEVLEHLEHPELAVKNILEALSDQGTAFITVPNGRLDFFEGHVHFWSIDSFKIFLHKINDRAFVEFFPNNNSRLLGILKKCK